MFTPSEEQQEVHAQLKRGVNVVVDACAGSGKSTTVLSLAKAMPRKQFLHITYNSMLRKEFQENVRKWQLTNLEVHTFHSLCVKYFTSTGNTDAGLRTTLAARTATNVPIPKYHIVVLDEVQDMTPLYFHFVRYFLSTIRPKPKLQLLLLGDYRQGLYEFKGSDVRFLTHAHRIWAGYSLLKHPDEFAQCTLRMSYRVTHPMAQFVNDVMLGDDRLLACRDGVPVSYFRNSRYHLERMVTYQIRQILLQPGNSPSDIFVLGASVKGANSLLRHIENALVEADIPCHVPRVEDGAGSDRMDERVIQGKVVFSTFHTVKGRQRKYVFVTGFDQSYFTLYDRSTSGNGTTAQSRTCPNTLYVATTRATHQLFVLETNQHTTDRPLEFLKKSHHEMIQAPYIDFKGMPQTIFYEYDEATTAERLKQSCTHYLTPTDLIRFVPETVLDVLTPILKRLFVTLRPPAAEPMLLPNVITVRPKVGLSQTGRALGVIPERSVGIQADAQANTLSDSYEDVSDINGVALPCLWWERVRRSSTLPTLSEKSTETNMDQSSEEDSTSDDVIDENQGGSAYGMEVALVSQGTDTGEPFLRKQEARRSFDESIDDDSKTELVGTLYQCIEQSIRDMRSHEHGYLRQLFRTLPKTCTCPAEYLYMSNVYLTCQDKLYYKLKQIPRDAYEWLTDTMVDACCATMDAVIGKDTETIESYEHTLIHTKDEDLHASMDRILNAAMPAMQAHEKYRFHARLDLVTKECIWEIKCTQQLTIEHMLQVVIYAWIARAMANHGGDMGNKQVKILNIKSGEVLELCATLDELTEIIVMLIQSKYARKTVLTEDEFLAACT
jgi:hypothetical protein